MLFGLAQSLRSLTKSPMASLVQEAHRMARRGLEVGGGVGMGCGGVDARVDPNEFILPSDVDARPGGKGGRGRVVQAWRAPGRRAASPKAEEQWSFATPSRTRVSGAARSTECYSDWRKACAR